MYLRFARDSYFSVLLFYFAIYNFLSEQLGLQSALYKFKWRVCRKSTMKTKSGGKRGGGVVTDTTSKVYNENRLGFEELI